MTSKIVQVSEIKVSNDQPMTLFGGINVFESRDMACLLYTSPSPRDS